MQCPECGLHRSTDTGLCPHCFTPLSVALGKLTDRQRRGVERERFDRKGLFHPRECQACGSWGPIEKHHLIPISIKMNKRTVDLCPECHDLAHENFTHYELFENYYTIDKLRKVLKETKKKLDF